MAYFWLCPTCGWRGTFDDDEEPQCFGCTDCPKHQPEVWEVR